MSEPKSQLLTPIYIKPRDDTAWPEDSVFYMLTRSGLFLCRNHPFYQSAVPAPQWPTELAEHQAFLAVRYPKIPRRLVERVVGFFERVADAHNTEAAVLLVWNKARRRVQVVVPDQVATIGYNGWGATYPIGVEYEVPIDLLPDLVVIGDMHSHVFGRAIVSGVDKRDEIHRPGLHIVVGQIHREPPEFHIEAVTDGVRFTVRPELALGGYQQRCTDIPDAWMDKVTVEAYGKRHGKGNQGRAYGARAVNKSDGYGDYARCSTEVDDGRDDNGQICTRTWSGESGCDRTDRAPLSVTNQKADTPLDDEALVEETIHKEILENLDVAESLPEDDTAQSELETTVPRKVWADDPAGAKQQTRCLGHLELPGAKEENTDEHE